MITYLRGRFSARLMLHFECQEVTLDDIIVTIMLELSRHFARLFSLMTFFFATAMPISLVLFGLMYPFKYFPQITLSKNACTATARPRFMRKRADYREAFQSYHR